MTCSNTAKRSLAIDQNGYGEPAVAVLCDLDDDHQGWCFDPTYLCYWNPDELEPKPPPKPIWPWGPWGLSVG